MVANSKVPVLVVEEDPTTAAEELIALVALTFNTGKMLVSYPCSL